MPHHLSVSFPFAIVIHGEAGRRVGPTGVERVSSGLGCYGDNYTLDTPAGHRAWSHVWTAGHRRTPVHREPTLWMKKLRYSQTLLLPKTHSGRDVDLEFSPGAGCPCHLRVQT